MGTTSKWSALGAYTTAVDGLTAAPTLKNLANAAQVLGNAIDNTASKDQYVDLELKVRGAVAFSAGGFVSVWLIEAADGANYEDGDGSTTPARPPDLVFPVRAVSTQQRIALRGRIMPAGKFKCLVQNNAGQAFTNTDSENILSYVPYDDDTP